MSEEGAPEPAIYRTLFLSDVHLGTRGCQAGLFLDFLKNNDAATIYLVGDIIDEWQLKNRWYWPQTHNDIVQKLLRKARKGVRVIYVPGNHDEFARGYFGSVFGGVRGGCRRNPCPRAARGAGGLWQGGAQPALPLRLGPEI